jgi:hypothetical protein
MQLAYRWSSTDDDERILASTKRVIDTAVQMSQDMYFDYKYIYQNYASLDQDVFAGYGEFSKRKLMEISKKYDPRQIFQKLQPGYFKLDGRNGGLPT